MMSAELERDRNRRRFFDESAAGWEERNYNPEILSRTESLIRGLNIPEGGTILDVGCGRGVLAPILRRLAGPGARLLALDSSAAMLKGVADKDSAATALLAPAENIPLIDNYADAAVCFSAFPHFSDQSGAVREFFRVLKPGGFAYILHLGDSEMLNLHHEGHPAVRGDRMPTAERLRLMFAQAGFHIVTAIEEPERYILSAVKPEVL